MHGLACFIKHAKEALMNTKGERVFTSLVGDFAGGTPVFVHVKDDRIIRIRPIIFEEEEAKTWSIVR
jgi:hypothetical protein